MKKVLKITAIAMALLLTVLCFAACGGKTEDDTTAPDTTAAKTDKEYLIVADNSFAPFEFLDDKTKTYIGIDMDILAAIAEDQGFKYKVDNCGWDAALGNLGGGQADGMIAGMTITAERQETYDFSNAYFEDGQILFVNSDSSITKLEDIRGKKVAVKTGTKGADYVNSIKDEYNLKVESFTGSDNVYAAVQQGNVDVGVEDYSVINYKIANGTLKFKTIGERVQVLPYGFAVQKGQNAELVEMFNKGLKNIKANGKYDEILAKYGM